ncbi:MAG TPA: hypothetical protein DCZ10_06610, partial [Pelotomaculum sp.]|nr:hypothetical protein [Pelotomaculum sp.]
MAFEIGPQIRYAPDGQRTYNKNGELVTHHGYFETLADQLAVFTRASVAYKQDGSQVASGVPRYEYARQPAPVWQDAFNVDQLAEYTSGGDVTATWVVSGGVLTGTGGTQATLIKNNLLLQDVEIEVNSDQADNGGIIARYQDNNNYYLLNVRDDTGTAGINIRLFKRVSGVFTAIAGVDLIWVRGTSKLIKFALHGSRIEAYFDGQRVISIEDTTFSGGGVGLRNTETDVASRYLDFKVYQAQQAAMVEEGATNLLTANQASVETNTAGFSTIDATISRDTTEHWNGTASLKIVYPGAAASERVTVGATGLTASRPYTFTVYLKGTEGSKIRLLLREMKTDGTILGESYSSDIVLTRAWQRAIVSRAFGAEGTRAECHIRNFAAGGPYAITV